MISIHLIPKAWSEYGVEALWTGQKNILCPVHNASTPCWLQAFVIRCIPHLSLVHTCKVAISTKNQLNNLGKDKGIPRVGGNGTIAHQCSIVFSFLRARGAILKVMGGGRGG